MNRMNLLNIVLFISILLVNDCKCKSIVSNSTRGVESNSTCAGVLESPWYCNDARFFEDPRCKFLYNFKWSFNADKSELEILVDYTRVNPHEIVIIGLLHQGKDIYFDLDTNVSLFQDYLYFYGQAENTRFEIVQQGLTRVTQKLSLTDLQCKRFAFAIYSERQMIYKMRASETICKNLCDQCYQELNMGDKCKKSEFRWFYDQQKSTCVQFIYNGCGGNSNNFKTIEDCRATCVPDVVSNSTVELPKTAKLEGTRPVESETKPGAANFDRILRFFQSDVRKKVNEAFKVRKINNRDLERQEAEFEAFAGVVRRSSTKSPELTDDATTVLPTVDRLLAEPTTSPLVTRLVTESTPNRIVTTEAPRLVQEPAVSDRIIAETPDSVIDDLFDSFVNVETTTAIPVITTVTTQSTTTIPKETTTPAPLVETSTTVVTTQQSQPIDDTTPVKNVILTTEAIATQKVTTTTPSSPSINEDIEINKNTFEHKIAQEPILSTTLPTPSINVSSDDAIQHTPLNEVPQTSTSSNESSIFNTTLDSSKVKFDITNFTALETNTSDVKSYALRLHIQGFKWNDRFTDVNSTESLNFLRAEIIPLLVQRLNLSVDDLHDVRLIRLFKGSVQSDLRFQTNFTLDGSSFVNKTMQNETITLVHENVTTGEHNATETVTVMHNGTHEYQFEVLKGYDLTKSNCSDAALANLIKHALLKHNENMKNLNVSVLRHHINRTESSYSVEVAVAIDTEPEISTFDVRKALEEFSLKETSSNASEPKHSFKFSDFWLNLENDIQTEQLGGDANLFSGLFAYQSIWMLSLIAISVTLVILFVGCLIAICYSRTPYRKKNKVYDMETVGKQNNQIPQIPSIQPATKTTKLAKIKDNPHMQY